MTAHRELSKLQIAFSSGPKGSSFYGTMADVHHIVKVNCWFVDDSFFLLINIVPVSPLFDYAHPTVIVVNQSQQVKVRQTPPGALVNMLGPHLSIRFH